MIFHVSASPQHIHNAYLGQLTWIFHRKRAQADSVEQLKDSRVSADSQRKGHDSDDRKTRIQAKCAKAVADILPQTGRKRSNAGNARRLRIKSCWPLGSSEAASEPVACGTS